MYYQDHLQTLQVAENKVFNWISEPCRPSWKSRNLMGFQHFKNSLRLSKVSVRNSNNQNSKSLVRKKKASLVKSVSSGLQHCPKSIFYSDHLKLDVPPTPPLHGLLQARTLEWVQVLVIRQTTLIVLICVLLALQNPLVIYRVWKKSSMERWVQRIRPLHLFA